MSTQTDDHDELDKTFAKIREAATKQRVANVTVILDRSGSMESIRTDVLGGINAFLDEQKRIPGDCNFTLWQFDSDAIEKVVDAIPITKQAPLTPNDFIPRNLTPLYDAIGKAISDIRAGSKGEAQLVLIVTDGYENASQEYSRQAVRELIRNCENDGWVFSYVGANQDSYAEAGALGIPKGNVQNYQASAEGVKRLYGSVSRSTASWRTALATDNVAVLDSASTQFFGGTKEAEEPEGQ